ncbi:MAG: hypothetical protein AB7D39_11815 [Pseudodesulfovibrio sp.]|uniref:hypothetical protein n=1 Tax=Pseudodesulfovibrio sp. TaxID=2035812 RepID=UPI003D0F406E
MLKKLRWRLLLVLYALVLPIYYVWVAVKELWEEDSLPKVYGLWWKSFKKGGKL